MMKTIQSIKKFQAKQKKSIKSESDPKLTC